MGELWARYHCPHCGGENEIPVDTGGSDEQNYIEDCQVCCKPNVLSIHVDLQAGIATVWNISDG